MVIQCCVWCQGVVGQHRMRFRVGESVLGGRLGGVEVGVEGEGVVGVALQGSDAVVMGDRVQGVADGVGEQRVRADLHEGRVLGTGRGDGLAEPHRVAQVDHPVVGIEDRRRAGVVAGGGDRPGSSA